MEFMSSQYQEHKQYAFQQIDTIYKKIDFLSWTDEDVCNNYEDYIQTLYEAESDIIDEIQEWQEDQDLPTKEKIDALIVESLMDVMLEYEDISLYDALYKSRPIYN